MAHQPAQKVWEEEPVPNSLVGDGEEVTGCVGDLGVLYGLGEEGEEAVVVP